MRLHVHIGMIARSATAGMGLLFKDYKDRMPSDAEMLDDALGKLRSYFRGLEWELKSSDAKPRLAGRPAQVLEFQGVDADEVTMNGECYMTAFRGYGYWFFTWVPLGEREINRESIQTEWRQLRQRLTLLDGRKGWTERPPESEKIAGKKATYQLAYVKELWTREPADNYDPPVDLVLKGHEPDPERRPLAGKDATVQVLVLPKQANLKAAAAAVRDHVKQRERKLYERTTLEPMKDKHGAEIDRAADIGTEHGHLSKFRMKNTEDLERYLVDRGGESTGRRGGDSRRLSVGTPRFLGPGDDGAAQDLQGQGPLTPGGGGAGTGRGVGSVPSGGVGRTERSRRRRGRRGRWNNGTRRSRHTDGLSALRSSSARMTHLVGRNRSAEAAWYNAKRRTSRTLAG